MALEQKHYDMLVEHLPYEIDMLRNSYAFLSSTARLKIREAIPENAGTVTFLNNTVIEAFWIHARCLLEFFQRVSQTEGRTSCAQDFTRDQPTYDLPFENLTESINNQICHLNYARFRNSSDKIDGFTMRPSSVSCATTSRLRHRLFARACSTKRRMASGRPGKSSIGNARLIQKRVFNVLR
jgi:hypothetical protein